MVQPGLIGPAVELPKASGHDFFVANQRQSHNKRLVMNKWLAGQEGIGWYNGEMPDTTYHAVLTVDHGLLGKNGVRNPPITCFSLPGSTPRRFSIQGRRARKTPKAMSASA
jgi:hypothetical protein